MKLSTSMLAGALVATATFSFPTVTSAHGGGLDASGCHTNRRTGDYHCHRETAPRPPPVYTPQRTTGGAVYYANCAAARAAGAAPVMRGQPGYGPHLDRDNDGVGCE